MDEKILVTYASTYGSTKEIAEKVGGELRQVGLAVDVLPVDEVHGLAPYRAVILGSGVYIGQWKKEAAAFLKNNESALAGRRQVWLFSSGPTGSGDPADLLAGWRLPEALRPVADRIHPCDVAVFHGNIDPKKLNFLQRWAIKNIVKAPTGDFRDWGAIANWSHSVAETLKVPVAS